MDLETLVYRVWSDVELPAGPGGRGEASKPEGPVDQGKPLFHMFRRAMLTTTTALCVPESKSAPRVRSAAARSRTVVLPSGNSNEADRVLISRLGERHVANPTLLAEE